LALNSYKHWLPKSWPKTRSEGAVMKSQDLTERTGVERRMIVGGLFAGVVSPVLMACTPQAETFQGTDITGANYAKDFKLRDHHGQVRSLGDFQGKVTVVFFGFTQCPDVCPTSMATMAEVKRLLGTQSDALQVLFITVDPERDTLPLLKAYMSNFDPTFLALRPELAELGPLAADFKIYYKKVDGKTPTSYTMDHSAGKFIFDTQGQLRLFSQYGTEANVLKDDIQKLLKVR
jgi:protein SCO1